MSNYKVYLVGGAVRDKLLNIEHQERDWVVVGATADDLVAQGFNQVGKDFPVFLHPKTREEYALARQERKVASGYHGFEFSCEPSVTIEEDLLRRDLTINAIAEDEATGELVDPYGGVQDVQNKILRHVSSAFVEDPVRVLRVARFLARFYSLGFKVASETVQLMQDMVQNGEVNVLVQERIFKELEKALQEKNPEQFFLCLRECGALQIIFPEIDNLFGVPQTAKWHPEVDTGIHTMLVLQAIVKLSSDPRIRFAALVHDLGKALTPPDILPAHHGHEERSYKLVKELCERIKAPKAYASLALKAARFHGIFHKIDEMRATTIVKTLRELDAFRNPQEFENFILVCIADSRGRTGHENNQYPQADKWRAALAAAQSVKAQQLVDEGFSGMKLANKLHQLQAEAVERVLK